MAFKFKSFCYRPNKKDLKTVNIFLGFFFILNYCLGTGYLGVPFAFLYSGFMAAIPTMVVITLVSWINANYILEVMARAQVSAYVRTSVAIRLFSWDHAECLLNRGGLLIEVTLYNGHPWDHVEQGDLLIEVTGHLGTMLSGC